MRRYRRKFRLLQSMLATAPLLVTGNAIAQMPPADTEIADAVAAELRYSDIVEYNLIRLTVEDGIVSITGTVPSITASRQIDDVTATVRGVRSIVNQLRIEPGPTSSDQIQTAVLAALDDNPAMDLYELDVVVGDEGHATISGHVDSWVEFDLAETIVGTVKGVRSIDNRIEFESAGHYRGEGEIADDITELLRWDARVNDALISVLVREAGRVMLSGTVGSLAEKRLATSLAHVPGVRDVDASNLDVESWARDDDLALGVDTDVNDADIVDAIESALELDPRVAAVAIDVSVVNGETRLRGEVDSVAASRAAERAAQNTRGSLNVHNLLTVRPVDMENEDIVRRIVSAIGMANIGLSSEITVSVDDRQAHIVGDVASAEQYWRIDEIVANTRGVEAVTNDLTIRGERPRIAVNPFMDSPRVLLPGSRSSQESPTDRSLYSAVQSELFWSPFVDEDEVNIAVDEGTVTLSGVVDSMNESISAMENAYEAGAMVVVNDLVVE